MKIKLTILFLFSGILRFFTQPPPVWSSSVSSNFLDYNLDAVKIKMNSAGELIVVGNTMNSGSGNKDILLIKYNPAGNIIWLKTFNGPANNTDEFVDFVVDSQDNIYITGRTYQSTNSDILTLKYNTLGTLMWNNYYNGNLNIGDEGISITVDQLNNCYVIGNTDSDNFNGKQIVFKINSVGNIVWKNIYGSDANALYFGEKIKFVNNQVRTIGLYAPLYGIAGLVMVLDVNGNVVLSNEIVFVSGGINAPEIDDLGNFYFGSGADFAITKINANGNFAWRDSVLTTLPYNVSSDQVNDIIIDSLQNIYVTGRHTGVYGVSNNDMLLVKYTQNGNIIWSQRYNKDGANTSEIGNSIALDKYLNVYVAGEGERNPLSDNDYIVAKFDVNGVPLGIIRYDDTFSKDDFISSIVVDGLQNIYVTGITQDTGSNSNTTTQKYNMLWDALSELKYETSMRIFPNPFSSPTGINISGLVDSFSIKIFNIMGQVVFEDRGRPMEKTKNINPDISPGCYSFVLESRDQFYSGKLLKVD